MLKKYGVKISSFIIAAAWTAFFLFSVIHNSSNKRFTVVHHAVSQIPGYAVQPGYYNVQTSPALNWDNTGGFGRVLGWVFLIVMWGAFFVTAADLHLGKKTDDASVEHQAQKRVGAKSIIIVAVPTILSMIFFFTNYSSSYVSNHVQVDDAKFNQWVMEGKVEQRGANTYVDATDDKVLLHLFDGKRWIK